MKPIDMEAILQMLYILQCLADPNIEGDDRQQLLEQLRDQRSRVGSALQAIQTNRAK